MWDVMLRRWLDLLFWWAPKKDRTPRRPEQGERKRGPDSGSKAAQPSARPGATRPDQRPARTEGRGAAKPAARPASGPAAVKRPQSVKNGPGSSGAGARGAARPTTASSTSAVRNGGPSTAGPGASAVPEPKTAQLEKAVTAPVPDDLTVIKGIGPALQNRLRALGITTFADLAEANPDKLMAQLKGGQPLSRARVQHWTEAARARART
jgi:predicted flap endonuclease-1-like 5' DNA nuclease